MNVLHSCSMLNKIECFIFSGFRGHLGLKPETGSNYQFLVPTGFIPTLNSLIPRAEPEPVYYTGVVIVSYNSSISVFGFSRSESKRVRFEPTFIPNGHHVMASPWPRRDQVHPKQSCCRASPFLGRVVVSITSHLLY